MLRHVDTYLPIRVARCEFVVAAPTNVPRALMAGEYPPTKSRADAPHANPTSAGVSAYIGYGRHDWIDIVPYAPVDTPSGLIDRRALKTFVLADREVQANWIGRVASWVDACGAAGMVMPVVYIAGGLCNAVWAATSHARFTVAPSALCTLGTAVCVYTTGATQCLVMLDQPHPSWPLVSHGDPIAVASLRLAMRVLKGLLSEAHQRATWDAARVLAMIDDTERLRLQRRSAFMARIGIRDGKWPTEIRHFRDAPYDDDAFMDQLDELLAYGLSEAQLRCVMAKSLFNRPLERSARDALSRWLSSLGPKAFVTLMCDGVAAALASPSAGAFEARMQAWLKALGPKGVRDVHVRRRRERARIDERRRVRGANAGVDRGARSEGVRHVHVRQRRERARITKL